MARRSEAEAEDDVHRRADRGRDVAADGLGMGEVVEHADELRLAVGVDAFLEVLHQFVDGLVAGLVLADLGHEDGVFFLQQGLFQGVF